MTMQETVFVLKSKKLYFRYYLLKCYCYFFIVSFACEDNITVNQYKYQDNIFIKNVPNYITCH